MLSIWEHDTFYVSTDVAIIGAGITGLFTSIELKTRFPELSVRVFESGTHPQGASVKNAGFACFGSLSEVLDDIANEGEDLAFGRVENRLKGLSKLKQTVDLHRIDYKQDNGFEIFSAADDELYHQCESKIDSINKSLKSVIGYAPYSFVDNTFDFKTPHPLLRIKGEGSLHSGKLIKELVAKASSLGVLFHFGCEVEQFDHTSNGWNIYGSGKCFNSQRLIIATNGFSSTLLPKLDVQPARGQLLLTKPISDWTIRGTFHANKGYNYFRALGNRLLLGGARDINPQLERTDSQEVTDEIQSALEDFIHEVILPFTKFSIEKRWAGTMAFGADNEKTPIIEEVENDLIVGTRLGGMGIAMAPVVAEKIVNQFF